MIIIVIMVCCFQRGAVRCAQHSLIRTGANNSGCNAITRLIKSILTHRSLGFECDTVYLEHIVQVFGKADRDGSASLGLSEFAELWMQIAPQ